MPNIELEKVTVSEFFYGMTILCDSQFNHLTASPVKFPWIQ